MSVSIRFAWVLLAPLLLSALCGGRVAASTCLRYVGDTASDPQCTDNDIQSAINNTVNNAACPNALIVITSEHTYSAQHLDINGKSVTLRGTPCTCDFCFEPADPTSPFITLSGAGHSGDSVLYIHGNSNVTLQYLAIQAGDNGGGYGGGIHFDGSGSLVLDTTWVRNNTANYGGGIDFHGAGGFAGLTILHNTQFINNSANSSGGGIRLSGSSYTSMLYDNTLVALNHAPNGYGGGINIVGPARADIGSPGSGGLGVVYSNNAARGGGLAVTAGSDGDAEVQLFSTDPQRPVRVHDNFASVSGGAIYARGHGGVDNHWGRVCASDFRIEDNAAAEGSAIHADNDGGTFPFGSLVYFNPTSSALCSGLPAAAQRCATGVPCNTVNDNQATDAQGVATLGATIRMDDSSIYGDRFAMQGNAGGYAIRSDDSAAVSNCLLTDNNVTRQLIAEASYPLEVRNCTLAHNTILSTDTIHAEGVLTLADSIIDQPGNLALAYSGSAANLHVDYVLSTDVSTLPAVEGVVLGAPTYINAANRNYRLQSGSLGLDFAPAVAGDDRDLDRLPHDQDLPEAGNLWGVRDLGAYERQRDDTIFRNGFEAP